MTPVDRKLLTNSTPSLLDERRDVNSVEISQKVETSRGTLNDLGVNVDLSVK